MYRVCIEQNGVFRRYSRWYASLEEVCQKLGEFLAKHQGLTYSVRIECGQPDSTDIGF